MSTRTPFYPPPADPNGYPYPALRAMVADCDAAVAD